MTEGSYGPDAEGATMSNGSPEVVVVGGGIGGLAAAFALRRSGHTVQVLEQAAEFGEVGAGIQLAPNATRVLAEWGLLDEVLATGVQPARLVLRDIFTGEELTHLNLGADFRHRYAAPYVVVHRSDLHRILLDACRQAGVGLQTDRHVERVDSTDDAAFTYCTGGTIYESAVVLGVDGLNSALRGSVVDDEPINSGYVSYRGTLPTESATVDLHLDDMVVWIGPGCHFVQYALRRREIVNQVAVFRSPAYARGEADWGTPDELDDAFAECCDHVQKSLVWQWRDRRWPMHDRLPVDRWVRGRLILLGDAAHPMLQYLAQGACQAIEDAHTIAAEAAKHTIGGGHTGDGHTADGTRVDWPAALKATQDARVPRTARVQRSVRTWGDIWHVDGIGRLLRNELLRTRDPYDYTYIDWLYDAY